MKILILPSSWSPMKPLIFTSSFNIFDYDYWRRGTVRSSYASHDHIIGICLKLMTYRTFWIPKMYDESA